MFFAYGNFLYSRFKIYVVFMSQILLLIAKYFIVNRHFLKTSYSSSHKLYMTIYLLVHQYLFCVRQANKICTLLSSHFMSPKVEWSYVSDSKWYILRSPNQILGSFSKDDGYGYGNVTKQEYYWLKKEKCSSCTCNTNFRAFLCRTPQNNNVKSPNFRF